MVARKHGREGRRLHLVNPRLRWKHYGAQEELALLLGKKTATVPLALPLLAALTPDRYDIRIVNDEVEALTDRDRPDLVGITVQVSTADRAFEIARRYRRAGSTVVLGGSYPTYAVEECLEHADCVVVGEAEDLWPGLLDDFEGGALRDVYRAEGPVSLAGLPIPRWDLVDTASLATVPVQASRGCPFRCEFCLVRRMFGHKVRYRDPDEVAREIAAIPHSSILFGDDNLTLDKDWARRLVRRLKELDVSWICQASLDIADDEELIREMADAGCMAILVGFESLDLASLSETRKRHNKVERYAEVVRKITSKGIFVYAAFIVGFDSDSVETFDAIARFVEEQDVLWPMVSLLAAAPGTALHERLKDAGRLHDLDPWFVNGALPGLRYEKMTMVEALDGYYDLLERIFSFESIYPRAMRLCERRWLAGGRAPQVTAAAKARASVDMLRRFVLTGDRAKRRLFLDLFAAGRRGDISMDKAVMLLMNAEANARYLSKARQELPIVRRRVAAAEQRREVRAM